MTFKTKHYIEVADIVGLHFQCVHCQAEIDLTPKGLESKVLDNCPVCRRSWAAVETVAGAQVIHSQPFIKLVEVLGELQRILGANSPLGFKMLLELAPTMPSISQTSEPKP
jgi:hypothetical protein